MIIKNKNFTKFVGEKGVHSGFKKLNNNPELSFFVVGSNVPSEMFFGDKNLATPIHTKSSLLATWPDFPRIVESYFYSFKRNSEKAFGLPVLYVEEDKENIIEENEESLTEEVGETV